MLGNALKKWIISHNYKDALLLISGMLHSKGITQWEKRAPRRNTLILGTPKSSEMASHPSPLNQHPPAHHPRARLL